jgi:preprotein translocase subunit Sec63
MEYTSIFNSSFFVNFPLVLLLYIVYLSVKNSPIDKFGGDSNPPGTTANADLWLKQNNQIIEEKKALIFRQRADFIIVTCIVLVILINQVDPGIVNDNTCLLILSAGLTSLGFKIGFELIKKN